MVTDMLRLPIRERYACEGPNGLGDAELISLVLGTQGQRHHGEGVAERLLRRFDGIQGIREAPVRALAEEPGIGEAMALRLHAALALGARASRPRVTPDDRVHNAQDVVDQVGGHLRSQGVEEFWALYMNKRSTVLDRRQISRGSLHCTVVDPLEVFRPAMQLRAAFFVVAHNHPSGDPEPSADDIYLTGRLAEVGTLLGVPLADHIIIGRDSFVSLLERGTVAQMVHPRRFNVCE